MDAMSCLAPHPASFLPTAASPAYYTDAAVARALHYSISDHYSPAASPSSSSSLLADFPCSAGAASGGNWFSPAMPAPPPTGLTCDSVLVTSDAAPRPPSTPVTPAATTSRRRLGLGVAAGAGRAGKRRPRASKRAPTTYITTDPSNFRLMVQHVTGIQAEPTGADDGLSGVLMPASFDASAATAALLDCPTYDSAFADALRLPSGDNAAAALQHRYRQQEQQQPCFPTLDSWSVMYETSQML